MKTTVAANLTLMEAEVLIHFIAKREKLWLAEAHQGGVMHPERILLALTAAHQAAVLEIAREHQK